MSAVRLERVLPDESATDILGSDLAMALRSGDILALEGDLGVGKTALARAIVRALAGDHAMIVPSPTFTLVQSYATRPVVHHFDLYRLSAPEEIEELGFREAWTDGAVLVEWPRRAESHLPPGTVLVEIVHHGVGRKATITGRGVAFDRIARSLAIRDFLTREGFGSARRFRLAGDASARAYEVVDQPGTVRKVLMDSPPLKLGPPIRDGLTYAEIAHTARNVTAFVGIARLLKGAGICAPEIYAADLEQGFLLIEHLGDGTFLDRRGRPVRARYASAAQELAKIHGRPWPRRIEAGWGRVHEIPPYDRDAMMIEVELLLDWYVPFARGGEACDMLRGRFRDVWNRLIDRLAVAEKSIVLRDFHSPNLIWRMDREGSDRLGVIDFQDALFGPAAYDVASLAMDARVSLSESMERSTVDAYVAARRAAGAFDAEMFAETYAIVAAQRNSKILGIFVRLDRRDGKPQYIRHLPRIREYLRRALKHPSLSDLRDHYDELGISGRSLR